MNVRECNVSQDTIAVRLSAEGAAGFKTGFVAAYLNCHYGLALMDRQFQGNVQAHLSLPDGRKVPIPKFSDQLQTIVDRAFRNADTELRGATEALESATQTLTAALGLSDWRPPEPLTYTRRASEACAAQRIDAEYFHPAKRAYLERLRAMPGQPLDAHYSTVRDMFDPRAASKDEFVRNFDLTDALQSVIDNRREPMPARKIGSTKKIFAAGDVVISRLRAYLREIALVRTSRDIRAVGSSEFIVLRPRDAVHRRLSRAALLVFLRSHPVQTILNWSQDGSHHPRFGDEDLISIPVPEAVCAASTQIDRLFEQVLTTRQRARDLLAAAQRAVEIAIESTEVGALVFLSKQTGAIFSQDFGRQKIVLPNRDGTV